MVDDVTLPGTGSVVASDDVGGKHYQRIKITAGAADIAADSGTCTVSSSFSRPTPDATAYSIGDNISNHATAGSVTPLSFTMSASAGIIQRVRIRKSNEAVATPTIRLWLFESSPTVGSGDNVAFAQPLAASAGFVDVAVTSAGSDDAVGWEDCNIPVVAVTLYGLLQTQSAFATVASETFTVTLWYQNG